MSTTVTVDVAASSRTRGRGRGEGGEAQDQRSPPPDRSSPLLPPHALAHSTPDGLPLAAPAETQTGSPTAHAHTDTHAQAYVQLVDGESGGWRQEREIETDRHRGVGELAGCKRKPIIISSEARDRLWKAFVVWGLFSLGGWLAITVPNEWFPVLSNCVGFGFFLTFVTRRTRWLGVLALVALILSSVAILFMPPKIVAIGFNLLGITMLLTTICLMFCFFLVRNRGGKVPKELEQMVGRELLASLSELVQETEVATRKRRIWPLWSATPSAAVRKRRLDAVSLHAVIKELDAKLVTLSKNNRTSELETAKTLQRLRARIEDEQAAVTALQDRLRYTERHIQLQRHEAQEREERKQKQETEGHRRVSFSGVTRVIGSVDAASLKPECQHSPTRTGNRQTWHAPRRWQRLSLIHI